MWVLGQERKPRGNQLGILPFWFKWVFHLPESLRFEPKGEYPQLVPTGFFSLAPENPLDAGVEDHPDKAHAAVFEGVVKPCLLACCSDRHAMR